MRALFPDLSFVATGTDLQQAADGADILVTATSAQAPLLKAAWMKPGAFYSHVGGWEDEYEVAAQCQKIVVDDWETVKHRTQTLSRMYKDGVLADDDIHANLVDIVAGTKSGAGKRGRAESISMRWVSPTSTWRSPMPCTGRAAEAGVGTRLAIQDNMIFQHEELASWIRM